jgi:hypothetical protein
MGYLGLWPFDVFCVGVSLVSHPITDVRPPISVTHAAFYLRSRGGNAVSNLSFICLSARITCCVPL